MSKRYNPCRLPPWLRKTRMYCKQIILPIFVFQLIRTLYLPTTGDFIFLMFLLLIFYLLANDLI